MATRIVVPDAGQTTDELLLVRWYVKVGDVVAVGDVLADLETDKAVAELEAYVAGHVLALLAEEGESVTVGQALLWVGAPGELVEEDKPEVAPVATAQAETPVAREAATGGAGGLAATPAARTAARERGLALGELAGSGPDGCIVKRDVLEQAEGAAGVVVRPLSPMRRALAARLTLSAREIPQFSVAMEVDMTRALAVRETTEPRATVTDVVVKAAADVLAQFPDVNCRLEGESVRYLADVNVGVAVSVDDGLVVPVLAGADGLGLAEVSVRLRELVANAREGRLAAGARGSFTVSNLGMYGVKSFTAIINPPEAAILAVGGISDRLVLCDGQVVAVPTATLTLSCDHRLIDGALAARFLKAVRERLETLAPTEGA